MLFASVLLVALSLASPGAIPACVLQAEALQQRGDFAALRAHAEECRQLTGHPRNEFFLGLASIGLDDHPRAIRELQRYLAGDLSEEPEGLLAVAEHRLAEAKAAATPIDLLIDPPDGEVRLTIRREGEYTDTPLDLDGLDSTAGGRTLWLAPGTWELAVTSPGRVAQRKTTTAVAGIGQRIVFVLAPQQPARPPPPPPFPRRSWSISTGVIGGSLNAVGSAALAVGVTRWTRATERGVLTCQTAAEIDACRRALAASGTLLGVGAGFSGASLGMLVAGMTGRARNPRVAWYAEAGIGGALAVAGAALTVVSLIEFNRRNTEGNVGTWDATFQDGVEAAGRDYAVGAAVLGFGAGLGLTALAGALVDRRIQARGRTARRWGIDLPRLALTF